MAWLRHARDTAVVVVALLCCGITVAAGARGAGNGAKQWPCGFASCFTVEGLIDDQAAQADFVDAMVEWEGE